MTSRQAEALVVTFAVRFEVRKLSCFVLTFCVKAGELNRNNHCTCIQVVIVDKSVSSVLKVLPGFRGMSWIAFSTSFEVPRLCREMWWKCAVFGTKTGILYGL